MVCRICAQPIDDNPGKDLAPATSLGALHLSCQKKLFGSSLPLLPTLSKSDFLGERLQTHTRRMSISGMQPKLSVALTATQSELKIHPVNMEREQAGVLILKPDPNEFPNAAVLEFFGMHHAQRFGIDTPAIALLDLPEFSQPVFAIRRFDRDLRGNKTAHVEDAMQVMGLQRRGEDSKYEGATAEEAGRGMWIACGKRRQVAADFLKRLVFSFLLGNGDHHLKNISIIRSWRSREPNYDSLAPAYDLVPTGALLGDSEMALTLLGTSQNPEFTDSFNQLGFHTSEDFQELGKRLGLPEKYTATLCRNLRNFFQLKVIPSVERFPFLEDQEGLRIKLRECLEDRLGKFSYTNKKIK